MLEVNLIITDDKPFGQYAESPQLPGFIMSRNTQTEFLRDYKAVMDGAITEQYPDADEYRVRGHHQFRATTPEGVSCLIRFETDDDHPPARPDREIVARQVNVMLTATDQINTRERIRLLDGLETSILGDLTFVCMAPSDPIKIAVDMLYSTDDVLTLTAPLPEQGFWILQMASPQIGADRGWSTLMDHGITEDMTVGQLMELNFADPLHVLVSA